MPPEARNHHHGKTYRQGAETPLFVNPDGHRGLRGGDLPLRASRGRDGLREGNPPRPPASRMSLLRKSGVRQGRKDEDGDAEALVRVLPPGLHPDQQHGVRRQEGPAREMARVRAEDPDQDDPPGHRGGREICDVDHPLLAEKGLFRPGRDPGRRHPLRDRLPGRDVHPEEGKGRRAQSGRLEEEGRLGQPALRHDRDGSRRQGLHALRLRRQADQKAVLAVSVEPHRLRIDGRPRRGERLPGAGPGPGAEGLPDPVRRRQEEEGPRQPADPDQPPALRGEGNPVLPSELPAGGHPGVAGSPGLQEKIPRPGQALSGLPGPLLPEEGDAEISQYFRKEIKISGFTSHWCKKMMIENI